MISGLSDACDQTAFNVLDLERFEFKGKSIFKMISIDIYKYC